MVMSKQQFILHSSYMTLNFSWYGMTFAMQSDAIIAVGGNTTINPMNVVCFE